MRKIEEYLLADSHSMTAIDKDGDLVINVMFSPEISFFATITCSARGYLIGICYHFGDLKHKYILTRKSNELNVHMREGCFYVDENGELCWKNFIPFMDSIGAIDVLRSYKTGIMTFLTSIHDFVEVMNLDVSDDSVVIIEEESA